MTPASGQTGTTTSVVIALLALLFFTRKVSRAKALSGPPSFFNLNRQRARVAVGRDGAAFAVGLLDIAIPRDDRPGGSFPRVMVNEACLARAVQDVSQKLVVSLRDAESMPAGAVRSYVSSLYQDVHDATIAADRPHLDVRVLLPSAATAGASRGGSSPTATSNMAVRTPTHTVLAGGGGGGGGVADAGGFSAPFPAVGGGGNAGWATREVAGLAPEVEVFFSDEPYGGGHQEILNAERVRAGFRPVEVVSLESVARGAYNPEYFYAEDVLADIPTFSQVACGGTFDRLHAGHKKLLTLAASMCSGGTLTVGVTSDSMLKSKANAHLVASLPERIDGVKDFLRTLNPHMQMRVEEITDPFGPPLAEEAFDAIAVSSETVLGGEKINELRAQKGFRPLAVAVTRRMAAATLSSSYLRRVAENQQAVNA